MTESVRDVVLVHGKLDLPVPEGVTEWRFTTVREGDKVTVGKIEVIKAGEGCGIRGRPESTDEVTHGK